MAFYSNSSDPLAIVTAPPSNETPAEKAAREKREAEAQRISDQIDDELRSERAGQQQMVKILLLGQNESAKFTLLKCLRVRFAREKWLQERAAWKIVLQLNLVQFVNKILAALQDPLEDNDEVLPFSDKHNLLRLRPLTRVERDLKQLLGIETEDTLAGTELDVRSHNWKDFLEAFCTGDTENCCKTITHNGVSTSDITKVIVGCRNDIIALCEDRAIREMLQRDHTLLRGSASFFLDNAQRLTNFDYKPTDDDINHARLRIIGIQEFELDVSEGDERQIWKIYDIGSSRSQRHAWLPYFDQVDAIIFLAPLSGFDESLQEDPRVNRLEDSFTMWKTICSSKLLSKAALVVLFNDVDILANKLANGVMIKRYMPSYGDRPNDIQSVVRYLCQKFMDIHKYDSPEPRTCHIYPAPVIVEWILSHISGDFVDVLRFFMQIGCPDNDASDVICTRWGFGSMSEAP